MHPIRQSTGLTIGFTILHAIESLVQRISDVAMHIFETLKALIHEGKQIIASGCEFINRFSFIPNSALEEEIENLASKIGEPSFPIPNLTRADTRNDVEPWLKKISSTSDFEIRQSDLLKDIYRYLRRAEQDAGFRTVFLNTIQEASTSCGDRMCLSILYISIAEQKALFASQRIYTPQQMKTFAEFLIRGPWAIGQLEELARTKLDSLSNKKEAIEVFLAYPIGLKQRLNLQFNMDTMKYMSISNVTPQDLDNAAEYIESQLIHPTAKSNILAGYEEWQQALQKHYPTEYEAIIEERTSSSESATAPEQYKTINSRFLERVAQLTSRALQD